MKHPLQKFSAVWSPAAAIIAFIIALILLSIGPGISLFRAAMANLGDASNFAAVMSSICVGLLTTLGMFIVVRWLHLTDIINDLLKKSDDMEHSINDGIIRLDIINTQFKHFADEMSNITRSIITQSATVVQDTPAVWSGLVHRLDSFNPSLLQEITISSSGTAFHITIDKERVFGNFLCRFQRKMQLNYIIYLPRQLGFGDNPCEVLLRLVHIVRCCRRRTGKIPLQSTVTLFLVDKPRPLGSAFLGYRTLHGRLTPVALEYFRSLQPGQVSTPAGEQALVCHNSERINALYALVEREVASSAKVVKFADAERILASYLPNEDEGAVVPLSASEWREIVERIYAAAYTSEHDEHCVVHPDHFAFHLVTPSIHTYREDPLGNDNVLLVDCQSTNTMLNAHRML